jgi:tRNA A-37 threonylcarbamoyl transferase component Bud32
LISGLSYHYRIESEYDHPDFRNLLEKISLDQSDIVCSLKEDTSASVWSITYKERSLVVKRYNTQSLWHAIRRAFRRSRADNCQRMTRAFSRAGIGVPPNVAVIQEQLGPFRARSWFICEYFSGTMLIDALGEWDVHRQDSSEFSKLKESIGGLFTKFRHHRLSHGDLKASNILWSQDSLCLIDLDAATEHLSHTQFTRAHQKDQARFMKNWQRQPNLHHIMEPLLNESITKLDNS